MNPSQIKQTILINLLCYATWSIPHDIPNSQNNLPLFVKSGVTIEQKFSLAGIDTLVLDSITDIEINESEVSNLTLRFDQNYQHMLVVNVVDQQLIISINKNNLYLLNAPGIEIQVPSLKNIIKQGMGDLTINLPLEGLLHNQDQGEIKLSDYTGQKIIHESSGNLIINNVESHDMEIVSSGMGDIDIQSGVMQNLAMSHTGSGDSTIHAQVNNLQLSQDATGEMVFSQVTEEALLEVKGLGDIELQGAMRKGVDIMSHSTGEISAHELDTHLIKIRTEGMGDIYLSGQTENFTAHTMSMAEINAEDLESKNIDLFIQGAGDITIAPLQRVQIIHEGMGTVNLAGSAVLDYARIEILSTGDVLTDDVTARLLEAVQEGMGECQIGIPQGISRKFIR